MRYDKEQLQAMAKSCQWYKANNPEDYFGFILTLGFHTGMHPSHVEAEINKMAVA